MAGLFTKGKTDTLGKGALEPEMLVLGSVCCKAHVSVGTREPSNEATKQCFEVTEQQSASACREAIGRMEPGTSPWWEEEGQQT